MSDLHKCLGVVTTEQKIIVCACVSKDMFHALESYFRKEIIGEIGAFANDYHHHVEGRDVVIVEQLLAFLAPPEGKEQNAE